MSLTITIGGTDRTTVLPFASTPDGKQSWITITETVPGTATAKLQLYDLDNSIVVNRLDTIVAYDATNGKNAFQGLVQKRKVDIYATWRVWSLDCVDLNSVTDTTLVGVPDGTHWVPSADGSTYTCTDPNAYVNGGSDAANVQRLFAAYWTYPVPIDTSTYVVATNPSIGYPDGVYWDRRTLRDALNDVASLSGPYTVWWIDADAKLHWTNKPVPGGWTGGYAGGAVTTGDLPMLFPQRTWVDPPVPPAPYNISDYPDGVTSIAAENVSVQYDDSGAAYALYANGATSFTYTPSTQAPVDGISPTTPQQSPLVPETGVSSYAYYSLAAATAVNAYTRTSAGCIAQPAKSVPAGTYYVNLTYVTPCSSGGGHFWEIKNTGTYNGWLVPATNRQIVVTPVNVPAPSPPAPTVAGPTYGVGGTGWVDDASPSWLSRYAEMPDAQTQADRDAKGNTALTYMSQSLVRGTADVVYPGILYRAGMGVLITSTQGMLTASLQMIQRVTTSILSGEDVRRAALEWGTAPLGNLGLRRQAAPKAQTKLGASTHVVQTGNYAPAPGSTITLKTQLTNPSGEPWRVQGKIVDWSVQVFDANGVDVTTTSEYDLNSNPNGWQFSSATSQTDASGASSTQFTLSTTVGLTYAFTATSPD